MSETTVTEPVPGDDVVVSAVTRRRLIPTPRQTELGHITQPEPDDDEASAQVAEPVARQRGRVREYAASVDPRAIEGPALPIVVFGLAALVAQWDDAALTVLLPEIRAEFGLSLAFIGTVSLIVANMTQLLALPLGYLADRVRRVWMIRLGMLAQNGASVVQAVAPGVPQVVAGRLTAGVGLATINPASFSLMSDYYPSRSRARVFSFFFFAAGVGTIAGPLAAGFLGLRYGWRTSLGVLGAVAVGVSLLTFFLREPVRGGIDRIEAGMADDLAKAEPPPVSFGEGVRAAWSIRTMRRIMIATPFLYVKGFAALVLLDSYFAEVFQFDPGQRGVIRAVYAGIALVGLIVIAPAVDRVLQTHPSRGTAVGFALLVAQAVGFVVLAVSDNALVSIAAAAPIVAVDLIMGPSFLALMSLVVPARVRGLGLQMIAPWQFLGSLLVTPVIVATDPLGAQLQMAVFAVPVLIAAVVVGTIGQGVMQDIRAARAANTAEAEARRLREEGRTKMLICRDVDVGYDGVQVLFNVDFDVEEGELVALLGTNGAGKSTLLRAIAGITEASNGAIFLDGRDITHAPPHEIAAAGVVMVPGGRAVFPGLTVADNLRAARWLSRDDPGDVDERHAQVLEFFPILRERADQQAGDLSGGEQQMVALGQAFMMRPRLLMIDELSLGLAPAVVEQLLETLRAIHAQGTTVVIVEQSLNVALTVAERAVYMEKGEVQFSGPTEELLQRPELVRSIFIGGAMGGEILSSAPRRHEVEGETREPVLAVDDVAVSFGGIQALRGASVDVSAGEIVGIIGPNGAGKTTLFDVISGFVVPDRGSVSITGTDVTDAAPDARARLGLARSFQNARLFPTMTVRETIAVFLEQRAARSALLAAVWAPQLRRSEQRLYRRVDTLIELLGLVDYADKFVGELSTGSRRVVDVACVLAQEPKALLLDEPSSGLAQAETEALGPLLLRIVRETGCGLLVIEHDVPLVSAVSHRLVAMELGSVIASGTPDEVRSDPRVLTAYLAASDATIERSGSRMGALTAALREQTPPPSTAEPEG